MRKFVVIFLLVFWLILLVMANKTNLYEQTYMNYKSINEIIKEHTPEYVIYVKKRDFKLFVIDKKANVVAGFNIAIGKKENFEQKIYRNDNGTPEGLYFVTEILSLDAPTNTQSYKKLARMNSVYFRASDGYHLWGYPDKDLGYNSYGARFFRINYPNEHDRLLYERLKRQNKIPQDSNGKYLDPGSGIGIHGTNDPDSIGHRISSGCIRMHNSEVALLDKYIKIGTPVYIEK